MKINSIILLLIFLSINAYSQIAFEKGTIVFNDGHKQTCLIKNMDWRDNPTQIEYKLSDTDKVKVANLKDMLEFSVKNYSKYVKVSVDVDRSSGDIKDMSTTRKPIFTKEDLLLKVLVEGAATLYVYQDGNLRRYFYKLDNQAIQQLVYKPFIDQYNVVRKNEYFRQQLLNSLKCATIDRRRLEKINYKKENLVRVFIDYNKCKNEHFENYEAKPKRDPFNLYLRAGLNRSSLSINSVYNSKNTDFENKILTRIGAEAEFVLPFNKNKWAIIIEPNYQHYKAKKISDVSDVVGGKLIRTVDYTSFELPIGLRYYIFLNKKSKLFVNTSFIFDFTSNDEIEFLRKDGSNIVTLDIESGNNLAFGLGYNYNKFSLEMRFQTPRRVLKYLAWTSSYNTMSIIVGYNVF